MRRLTLNGALMLIIGLGAFALGSPATAAIAGCEGGWDLKCDNGTCCTVCQETGGIGDCHPA